MKKIILVVGGHAWRTGGPQPLLSKAQEVFKSEPSVEVRPVVYKGIAEGKFTLGSMLAPILFAIDKAEKEGSVFLCGNSAGGHLAVCAAKQRSKKVKGVISIAGALDFSCIPLMENPLGRLGVLFSPILWAPTFKVPILLLHGNTDPTVLVNSSFNFYNKVGSKIKKIHVVENIGHDVSVLTAAADVAREFINSVN